MLCSRLRCTEDHSNHSYHEPKENNPIFPSYFFQTITFTLSSPVSQVVPPGQVFLSQFYIKFFFITCMLHDTYILSSFRKLHLYLAKSNTHKAHYTIFHIPLFLPPSHIKYSPHHPAVTKLSICFLLLTQQTKFHTHTK